MCGGGSSKPKPPPKVQPPVVQPPPIVEAAPEVALGNVSETESKRRKISRSTLRTQGPASGDGAKRSGLGS
jgi:hypothetical protein